MASDFRVPLDSILDAFGVPATVTRPAPNNTPVTTTAVWVPPLEEQLVGRNFSKLAQRKVLALPKADLADALEMGTIVEAAEQLGDDAQLWRVDGYDRADVDSWRVVVTLLN